MTPPIKTFNVDGEDYQFEEGMSWREWCNSDYNTHGAEIRPSGDIELVYWTINDDPLASSYEVICDYNFEYILADALIVPNEIYSYTSASAPDDLI